MNNQLELVRNWMSKFGQETPQELVIPSLEVRRLRASLILEEALECIAALGFCVKAENINHENSYLFLTPQLCNFIFVDEAPPKMEDILDGLVDLDWMNKGTLVAMGVSSECLSELELEILRANDSKFWTWLEVASHFNLSEEQEGLEPGSNINGDTYSKVSNNEHCYLVKSHLGKVLKSPSFSPPQLLPIIQRHAKNNNGVNQ